MNSELILVDDDQVLLVILEKMILKVKPETKITSFSKGKDALAFLSGKPESEKARYLLVDINLIDMSGWEFISELETIDDKFSKVILMTSSVSSTNSELAKKSLHVIGFFEKPISFENIHQIFELIEKD